MNIESKEKISKFISEAGKTGYIDHHKPELVTSTEIIIFSFNGFCEKCWI